MQEILKQLELIVKQHAQDIIMPLFNHVIYSLKADGSPVTEADSAMQKAMIESLRKIWPEYQVLGEEMTTEEQQLQLESLAQGNFEGLWVLDPLDGTTNFASGVPIFSVSIALIINNQVVLGVVYDPNRDEMFSAIKGEGAWLNGVSLKSVTERELLKQCTAQVDFKRLQPEMRLCLAKEHPYASQRNFGSGALDWCWLAAARSQIYIHGGQKLWDYVAGHLILLEAGGVVKTFSGEDIFVKSLTPRSVMAAVNDSLFMQVESFFKSMDCLN